MIVIVVSTNGIDAVKTVLQPTHDVIDMQMHMTQNSTKEDVEPVASNKVLKRDKRFLIFMGGGIAKVKQSTIVFSFRGQRFSIFADCAGVLDTSGDS